jgi:hypothetical protein
MLHAPLQMGKQHIAPSAPLLSIRIGCSGSRKWTTFADVTTAKAGGGSEEGQGGRTPRRTAEMSHTAREFRYDRVNFDVNRRLGPFPRRHASAWQTECGFWDCAPRCRWQEVAGEWWLF